MEKLSDLRLSKNMKYTALYWAMRFFEHTPDIFHKTFHDGTHIVIKANSQEVYINDEFAFLLDSHESFVKLEFVNRVLGLGYTVNDIFLQKNEFEAGFNGFFVKFITWDDSFKLDGIDNKKVVYKSRLVSGVLEYRSKIHSDNE